MKISRFGNNGPLKEEDVNKIVIDDPLVLEILSHARVRAARPEI